jgi:hypothetical protein
MAQGHISLSVVPNLDDLGGQFRELKKESFCHGVCQGFVVIMSHYEGGRARGAEQRLLRRLE